ncbi:uncharacterized protein BX664DRAFT_327835 [Halteromyces radiatus]|uniref:uncharacterized protein n=1 Tax=Halteromyces radiatus TaxID=101107 RepID=UPI0022200297|nr:uncharacterized protein BX664DRAFT_327835 [Halteromyces radiatus]KAI8092658.1 hypothetical protein BX664DRAFT_327835 [Halteromyces radiatus]
MLPNEIQQLICHIAITQSENSVKTMLLLLKVNKLWAHFVCSHYYRHYRIDKYVTFIGFYNTIVSKQTVLPYGHYIYSLDLTPINKYGVDMRTHELIRHCPNLKSVTLGHPTSLKPTTIRWMARYCKQLETLSVGALESFPFMLECDFSNLNSLKKIVFSTTPLLNSSLLTLPRSLQQLHLIRMDSLDTETMTAFFQQRQTKRNYEKITHLAIHRCPRLLENMTSWLPLNHLKWLSLSGLDVRDEHVIALLSMPGELDRLELKNTQITTKTLNFLATARSCDSAAGQRRLEVKELRLDKNLNLDNQQL